HGGGEALRFRGYGRYGPGEGYGEEVTGAGITADGAFVALASRDGGVHVWRVADGALVCTAGGEAGDDEDWLTSIAPGARWAAAAFEASIVPVVADAQRGVVRVLDLRSGDAVHTVREPSRAGAA